MTHVVCEPCINCKYTDCVAVCPVNCFYEGANFLAIHPGECIDCEACVPVCPTEAIFAEANVPGKWKEYTELNARLSQSAGWPNISEQKEAMGDKDAGQNTRDKLSEDPFAG